jgi:hypothetical protein
MWPQGLYPLYFRLQYFRLSLEIRRFSCKVINLALIIKNYIEKTLRLIFLKRLYIPAESGQ